MARVLSFKQRLIGVGLAALLGLAGWLAWTPLWTWYCLHGLAGAEVQDREKWVKRVARLDSAALPGLLDLLAGDDDRACANGAAALSELARAWGAEDQRTLSLAEQLRDRFALLAIPGQEAVLEWQRTLLAETKGACPGPLLDVARELLAAAARRADKGIQVRALALAEVLAERLEPAVCRATCRELARKGLTAAEAQIRARAAELARHAPFHGDMDLLRQVVPLLRDADPGVRKAAMLAVGPAKEIMSEEDLLPFLHDRSPEVRRECELVLRNRGLKDEHLLLGLLISDSQPSARLQVLHYLGSADVDPGQWLRRLSRDSSPAVRAAALRAAVQGDIDLGDRLRQMAQGDPSTTVRQLAAHYLQAR
jgi:hypothetical protein